MYTKYSWLALGVGLLAASGCFNPRYSEGIACSEQGSCPEGMECGLDGRCWLPGRACTMDAQCDTGVCDTATGTCADAACNDGVRNGGETDIDCGGGCAPCGDGMICGEGSHCQSQVCEGGTCAAPRCGDGVVNQPSEACDEGGPTATCTADCMPRSCGDGVVDPDEECDEGGVDTATCDADCTAAVCGDSYTNTVTEECDEGGVDTATCDADCTLVACGDSYTNTVTEDCDEGGVDTATCDFDCTTVLCGDGHVNRVAGEQCDDGNTIPGDGCDATCRVERNGQILIVWDTTPPPTALTDLLTAEGFPHEARSNGSGTYTSDLAQLQPFHMVIFYNYDRVISSQEHTALNQYVEEGGKLLVTGYDSTAHPLDTLLADVTRVITSGDYVGLTSCTVTNDSYPPLSGPYGTFLNGTAFAVLQSDHDYVQADTARGAVQLIAVEAAAKLTVAGNVGAGGGTVWYWNGNAGGDDWTAAGTAQSIFLNLLHAAMN
jgi:cysteine-rich repeat protein